MSRRRNAARLLSCALILSTLAACSLPRSGPTRAEILSIAEKGPANSHVVQVSAEVAAASRAVQALGFNSAFLNAGIVSADQIRPGDVLAVTVWENVDNGLLASVGQKVTMIQEIQVDQNGSIYMPYAGRLLARDKTPEQLRRLITERLAGQTPDPQVEVRRLAGDGATVSVIGGVAAPGVYPIEASTRRLSSMLSKAGGVLIEPDVAQIKVQRHGTSGTIWLQDLFDSDLADIALRAGDRIIVEEDRRAFTALGASGSQQFVPFTRQNLNVLEAIAHVGGLNSRLADPKGIFVFRDEPNYVANRVLGRTDLVNPQRVAYVVDLTRPDGMFVARDFLIRDGDTIYITEAPFVKWDKIISATLGTLNAATTVSDTANLVN